MNILLVCLDSHSQQFTVSYSIMFWLKKCKTDEIITNNNINITVVTHMSMLQTTA